jgi:hypothetical protein
VIRARVARKQRVGVCTDALVVVCLLLEPRHAHLSSRHLKMPVAALKKSVAMQVLSDEPTVLSFVPSTFQDALVQFMNSTSPDALADACLSAYRKSLAVDATSARRRLSRAAVSKREKLGQSCSGLIESVLRHYDGLANFS